MNTLFCLVHGEPASKAFSVKVQKNDTVDDLKKLIKREKHPRFEDIAADELNLWAVSVPVDDTTALKELALENNKDKGIQELHPVKKISKVFPDEPPDEHIHVIVVPPFITVEARIDTKLQQSTYNFELFVGRKRTAFMWTVTLETATINDLKKELFTQYNLDEEFIFDDTSLDFTIYDIKERHCPRSDTTFRSMLEYAVKKKAFRLSVHLVTPSKAFSSYNLNAVCKLYGLGNGNVVTLADFPKLDCKCVSGDAFDKELDKLVNVLKEHLLTTPFNGTNEATRSIYVYFFLHSAVSLFGTSTFTICVEKGIEGTHGHGLVDYAIDSRRTKRTVGVTEVKDEKFRQGIAQNAANRKRKACEMEGDEIFTESAFGIVADAEKFYFLECRLNDDGKASFKLSESVLVNYDPDFMKFTVAKVLGYMGWLLGEVEKPETSLSSVKKQRTVSLE